MCFIARRRVARLQALSLVARAARCSRARSLAARAARRSERPRRRGAERPHGALPRAAAAACRSSSRRRTHTAAPPANKKKKRRRGKKTLPQHRRLVLNGEGREDVRVHRDRRARGAQGHRGRRQRREQGAGHGVANFLFLLTRSNEIGRIHVDFRKANMTGTRAGPWLWLLYCCVPVGTRGGIGRLGCGPVAVRRALARGWR